MISATFRLVYLADNNDVTSHDASIRISFVAPLMAEFIQASDPTS